MLGKASLTESYLNDSLGRDRYDLDAQMSIRYLDTINVVIKMHLCFV